VIEFLRKDAVIVKKAYEGRFEMQRIFNQAGRKKR